MIFGFGWCEDLLAWTIVSSSLLSHFQGTRSVDADLIHSRASWGDEHQVMRTGHHPLGLA